MKEYCLHLISAVMTTHLKDKKLAKEITAYILQNLDKPLNISRLSKEFEISDFTLKRVFKTVVDTPVHHFILEKRLEKARGLLLKTNVPIKEMAGLVGFKRRSTFSEAFHKKFGHYPSSMRG